MNNISFVQNGTQAQETHPGHRLQYLYINYQIK